MTVDIKKRTGTHKQDTSHWDIRMRWRKKRQVLHPLASSAVKWVAASRGPLFRTEIELLLQPAAFHPTWGEWAAGKAMTWIPESAASCPSSSSRSSSSFWSSWHSSSKGQLEAHIHILFASNLCMSFFLSGVLRLLRLCGHFHFIRCMQSEKAQRWNKNQCGKWKEIQSRSKTDTRYLEVIEDKRWWQKRERERERERENRMHVHWCKQNRKWKEEKGIWIPSVILIWCIPRLFSLPTFFFVLCATLEANSGGDYLQELEPFALSFSRSSNWLMHSSLLLSSPRIPDTLFLRGCSCHCARKMQFAEECCWSNWLQVKEFPHHRSRIKIGDAIETEEKW